MIFATFMSIKDELTLRNNDLARKENDNLGVDKQILRQELGYTPIFIIPVLPSIYETLFRFCFTCPSIPQRLVFFESDEFDTISYSSWARYCRLNTGRVKVNREGYYNEYVVKEIKSNSVIKVINISNKDISNDINEISFCHNTQIDFVFSNKLKRELSDFYNFELPHLKPFTHFSRDESYIFSNFIKLMDIRYEVVTEEKISDFLNFVKSKIVVF